MSDTFKCAICGGTFPKSDDDEAVAELKQNFGNYSPANCDLVCDDCYEKIIQVR